MAKSMVGKLMWLGMVCVVLALFAGCSFDGTWRGNTAQGHNQAFTIFNERVTRLSGRWDSPGIGWWQVAYTISPGISVASSGNFHYTESYQGWEYFRFSGKLWRWPLLWRRDGSGEVRTAVVDGGYIYRTPIITWRARKDFGKSDVSPYGGLYLEPTAPGAADNALQPVGEADETLIRGGLQAVLLDRNSAAQTKTVTLAESGAVQGILSVSRFYPEDGAADAPPLPEFSLEMLTASGETIDDATTFNAGDTVVLRITQDCDSMLDDDVEVSLFVALN